MPKSKGRRQKKGPATLPPPPPSQSRRWWERIATASRLFWTLVVVLSAFVTIAGAVFFLPRVTVDIASESSSDPFSVAFVATNIGIMPLRHVNFSVGLCKVETMVARPDGREVPIDLLGTPSHPVDASVAPCSTPNGALMTTPIWRNHRLAPDEKFSGHLSDMNLLGPMKGVGSYAIVDADITMVVEYHPWIVPWTARSEFRFATEKHPDGTLSWIARTLDNR